MEKTLVFALSSSIELAKEIVAELGLPLGECEVKHFADGEIMVELGQSVRGKHVYIVQSTCNPVSTNLMEVLIAIDACKRASAAHITVIMPYFGYARQDRKARPRQPITSKLVASLLETAGANRVITMELHATQIQGFFDIPVDNMLGSPVFVKYYMNKFSEDRYDHNNFVVVSPDAGSVGRARNFAAKVHMDLAIVDKRRQKANFCEVMNVIGDVKGKTCILFDDLVDTAGSLCNAAAALVEVGGAEKVYACASHGVLSGPALERLENSYIEELMVLNTIPMPAGYTGEKIRQLDVAPLFAKAINRVYTETSISSLF